MTDLSERIGKIKDETASLRKEVKELKERLEQQNELIINLLMKQNALLEQASKTSTAAPNVYDVIYGKNGTELLRRFPLKNLEALAKYEEELNDENMQNNINIITNLLVPRGLVKNLRNVLSDEVIVAVNVDGLHQKKRLLDFRKFIDVLYAACNKENYPRTVFLNDLRRALKNTKNRWHKNKCIANKQKRLESDSDVNNISSDGQFNSIVKTEDIDEYEHFNNSDANVIDDDVPPLNIVKMEQFVIDEFE
ncbi:uncharacterized protein [Musca autumnalis]|uniref:uncharacterized protein n=1 Tax=Musca autumnalis TaxID=221902 RepID=UPI003CE741B0